MAARKKPAKKLGKKALKSTKGGLNFSALAFKYDGPTISGNTIKGELKLGGGLNYKP